LEIDIVPDSPSVSTCFFIPIVVEFCFALRDHVLLDFLLVRISHFGFLFPGILPEYGFFTIPYFPEVVCLDPGFVAPS
jgi:hypothetical protein